MSDGFIRYAYEKACDPKELSESIRSTGTSVFIGVNASERGTAVLFSQELTSGQANQLDTLVDQCSTYKTIKDKKERKKLPDLFDEVKDWLTEQNTQNRIINVVSALLAGALTDHPKLAEMFGIPIDGEVGSGS